MHPSTKKILQISIVLVGVLIFLVSVATEDEIIHEERHRKEEGDSSVSVIFGGDMLFDRYIRKSIEQNGVDFIFSCVDEILSGADVVVANLEGPITSNVSVSSDTSPGSENNYTFTHPPETATFLKKYNIQLVNLANNHIWNFGKKGVEETLAFLDAAGVAYIGDPFSYRTEQRIIEGVPLEFIAFTEFDGLSLKEVEKKIKRARIEGYVPIVYTHWGEEYVGATESERAWAHNFVEAGAALVVGSHPHVVQEYEEYQGISIYYSLGNFIFDQYFSDKVRNGLLLNVTFDTRGVIDIIEIPIVLEKDGRTCPVNSR
jgi:poly-gamma-glutamate synthesis protein (capsule biosynthesis protein)